MGKAREVILNKLKRAVHPEPEQPDLTTPVYHSIEKPLDLAFKENLETVNGSVYLCASEAEIFDKLKDLLAAYNKGQIFCPASSLTTKLSERGIAFTKGDFLPESIEIGISTCEFLIAHTGSVMVSSALPGGRQLFVYPPIHVVIAQRDQVVDYLDQAYKELQKKYGKDLPSQVTLITGPSRTADIEKTLVMGAHGPRELHVFVH